eukprot:GGOE01000713.1.p1 GENE.GGOE01000713.1~~GGOE01000713.1.p1  ORF type:complete len:374 (-),score=56.17 GGOE01000713.1:202-1227(-)
MKASKATPQPLGYPQPMPVGPPEGPHLLHLIQDPNRTVAVFFFRNMPEGHPFLQLCRALMSALRDQGASMVVCPFDVARPANASIFQSLQRPRGPIKKTLPRIVVFPKGNKEGIKLKGIKYSIPPVEAVKAFVIQADRMFPGHPMVATATPNRQYFSISPQTAAPPRRLSLPHGDGDQSSRPQPTLDPSVTKKGSFGVRVPSLFRSKSHQAPTSAAPPVARTPHTPPKACHPPAAPMAAARAPQPAHTVPAAPHAVPSPHTTLSAASPTTTSPPQAAPANQLDLLVPEIPDVPEVAEVQATEPEGFFNIYGRRTPIRPDPLPKPTGSYRPPGSSSSSFFGF